MPISWGVVVPVKRLAVAKTRLASFGDELRQRLALAFAADVVTAALAAPGVEQVLVVTDDAQAAELLVELGAVSTTDAPDEGLNPALVHGAELLRRTNPGLGVATLASDLPALRAPDLAAVLAVVEPGSRAFVADSAATGTTLLAAGPGAELLPTYGPRSRAEHLRSGARELPAADALRRDVDTPQDLERALLLGVGVHTAQVVRRLPTWPGGTTSRQATVERWAARAAEGAQDGSGSARADDGTRFVLPPGLPATSGLQTLRPGQRVQLELIGDAVIGLRLAGA